MSHQLTKADTKNKYYVGLISRNFIETGVCFSYVMLCNRPLPAPFSLLFPLRSIPTSIFLLLSTVTPHYLSPHSYSTFLPSPHPPLSCASHSLCFFLRFIQLILPHRTPDTLNSRKPSKDLRY